MASMITKVAAAAAMKKGSAAAVGAQPNAKAAKAAKAVPVIQPTPQKVAVQVDKAQFEKIVEIIRAKLGDAAAAELGKQFNVERFRVALGGEKAGVQASLAKLGITYDPSHDAKKLTTAARDHLLERLDEYQDAQDAQDADSGSPSGSSSDEPVDGTSDDASDEATDEAQTDAAKAKRHYVTAKRNPAFRAQWLKTFGKASAALLPSATDVDIPKDALKAALGGKVAEIRAALTKAGILDPRDANLKADQLVAIARDHVLVKAKLIIG